MKSHIQIRYEIWKKKEKYFRNYREWLKKIKKIAEEILGESRIIVFGSVVKGYYHQNSDIDVLIISDNLSQNWIERRFLRTKVKSQLPFLAPFQIHLATPKEFENWYKNFIKEFVEI